MGQIFQKQADKLFKFFLLMGAGGIIGTFSLLYVIDYSPYNSSVGTFYTQVVPFSHEHHVGGMDIDCRYCHYHVERSAIAGVPESEICMNCHSQIWRNSEMLKPIRKAYRGGEHLKWRKIYDLPDFTYFNHAVHVRKGVGCETCHGRVDRMPLLTKAVDMKMEWCLKCHRNPFDHLRPLSAITTMGWKPPFDVDRATYQRKLAKTYKVSSKTECYTCHR